VSKAARARRLEGAHRSRAVDTIAMNNAVARDVREMQLTTQILFGSRLASRVREPEDHRPSGGRQPPVTTYHLL
jgi:hypothetical protein